MSDPKNVYQAMALADIEAALNRAKNVGVLNHTGEKGYAREIFLQMLLQPYLIPKIGISSGVIINPTCGQSRQVDIILYNKEIIPPIVFTEGRCVVPCEAVLATIEVKSKLTNEELTTGIINGRSVKDVGMGSLVSPTPNAKTPTSWIFAYESDWNDTNKIKEKIRESIKRENDSAPGAPCYIPISGICVPKIGFVMAQGIVPEKADWIEAPVENPLDETLAFLATVITNCHVRMRSQLGGSIGAYLSEVKYNDEFIGVQTEQIPASFNTFGKTFSLLGTST
ncbi:MAG: DUF6602 domain-containing protein [Solirubrobacterales bacterium]